LDTDNEDLAGLEKALQVVANGDFARGGRMFRDHMQRWAATIAAFDEAKTGRRRQRAHPKMHRQNKLGELIIKIIQRKPALTVNGLIAELRKEERRGVVEQINDDEKSIEWMKFSGATHSVFQTREPRVVHDLASVSLRRPR
jgi:hypothetical protein